MFSRANSIQENNMAPATALRWLLAGSWISQSLYVMAKLGVADLLKDRAMSCEALSQILDVHSDSLYRMMRGLTTLGVFIEDEGKCYRLSPSGQYLRSDIPGSLRALAIWNGEISYPIWEEVLYSVQTGLPASSHVFQMEQFQYLSKNPDASAIFNEAMTGLANQVVNAVVTAYDFSLFNCIVDVGGGSGLLLSTILNTFPAAHGILFEEETVAMQARQRIQASDLEKRCEIEAGDFFNQVPSGGDVYILSSIVHDWDDERSVAILRNCRQAMTEQSKLLLIECVIPSGNGLHFGALLDLQMLVMTGGRERSVEDFQSLLNASGFQLAEIVSTQAPESILVGVPV